MSSFDIFVRPMVNEDCAGVVELIRSCYGDTYGVEYFCHVDALISEMESGRLRSIVALKDRQTIGHMALLQRHPQARVCEAGNTVVHSSARGEGLMIQLAFRLHELAVETGLTGYIHYPTTAHPIMQKASVDYGGVETGLMLRYIAAESDFQQNASRGERLATTVAYQPVADAPAQKLLRLPERYAEFMAGLYQQLALPRQTDCQPSLPLRRDASFTASFNQRWQYLQMDVEKAGENLADEVAALINRHKPCVSYIDLPVDGNGVDPAVESLNDLGFFYAGLLPEFAGTDILRLQKLSDAAESDFQPDLANEAASRLLEFIREDAHSIGVPGPGRVAQRREK
jgi:hypothetical protein